MNNGQSPNKDDNSLRFSHQDLPFPCAPSPPPVAVSRRSWPAAGAARWWAGSCRPLGSVWTDRSRTSRGTARGTLSTGKNIIYYVYFLIPNQYCCAELELYFHKLVIFGLTELVIFSSCSSLRKPSTSCSIQLEEHYALPVSEVDRLKERENTARRILWYIKFSCNNHITAIGRVILCEQF